MDEKGDPCDDFYTYACGSHQKGGGADALDPADQVRAKVASDLSELSEEQERAVITINLAKKGLGQWPLFSSGPDKKGEPQSVEDVLEKTGLSSVFEIDVVKDKAGHSAILNSSDPDDLKPLQISALKTAVKMLNLYVEDDQVEQYADSVVEFADKWVKLQEAAMSMERATKNSTAMTINEIESEIPSVPWLKLFNNEFKKVGTTLTDAEIIEVFALDNLKGLVEFYSEKCEVAKSCSPKLMPEVVSKLYVENNFNDGTKWQARYVLNAIGKRYYEEVMRVPWADQESKKPAMEKIWNIVPYVGYAPWLMNASFVDGLYEKQRILLSYFRPVNFGTIGTAMAHEMTVDLIQKGLHYDSRGMIRRWWTDYTQASFYDRAGCLLKQYGSIVDTPANMTPDEMNRLIEAVADNAALRIAFQALLASEEEKPMMSLPGLEKFSPEQLYFLSYASLLCAHESSEGNKETGVTSEPFLNRYRVNVPMMNMEEFSSTFQCPSGSRMRLEDGHSHLRTSNVDLKALNSEVEALMTDDLAADGCEVVMQYDAAANGTLVLLEHHIDVLKSSVTPASSTTSAMGARPYEGAPSGHRRLQQSCFTAAAGGFSSARAKQAKLACSHSTDAIRRAYHVTTTTELRKPYPGERAMRMAEVQRLVLTSLIAKACP
ncbi:hypothetical protein MRX96_024177 [Rhipicephalus microplus]